RNSEKLTEDDRWYLERYLGFSNELRKAYHLKEWFSQWFKKAKENGVSLISETKESLKEFYRRVEKANIPEFKKAIRTLQNWQIEILNSFAYD
ncbi:transposase, partial [Robertmurraya sp. DFI.2.37]